MIKTDDIELTEDEIKKVNEITIGIQSDLNKALDFFKNDKYDEAIEAIKSGMNRTSCPICHKKLTLLTADVVHTKTICPVDRDLCEAEKEAVIETAINIKDEFVPMATKKKAKKDKAKEQQKYTLEPPKLLPNPFKVLLDPLVKFSSKVNK